MLESAIIQLSEANATQTDANGVVWIEALGARKYHTPFYGAVPVTTDKLHRMAEGFKNNVRGQEIATNYDHGVDRAKGNAASGWFKDFKVAPSSDDPNQLSLWTAVAFNEEAKREIRDGKWKYFSLEWEDYWTDNNGHEHRDVIVGGAITNRPVAKKLAALPVNFSESMWDSLDDQTRKQFAVWSTAYVNDLPDSCFLYVESGGKDSEGKTTPRTLRHFPYKDANGKVDLPHLRNAIARIPQSSISSGLKVKLQTKARSMLKGKKMAELANSADPDAVDDATIITNVDKAIAAVQTAIGADNDGDVTSNLGNVLSALRMVKQCESDTQGEGSDTPSMGMMYSELVLESYIESVNESKEWEHSEPGTGTPQIGSPEQPDPGTGQYVPRKQGDPSQEDPAIGGGWRRDPMPQPPDVTQSAERDEGGSVLTDEEYAELLTKLELPADAPVVDVIATAGTAFSEAKALRDGLEHSDQEKKFAETYPTMFAEHMRLLNENRENKARMFSESVAQVMTPEGDDNFVATNKGLSSLAKEKITEVHKKFSEGTAGVEDFEDAITAITRGGIVDFSESGSSIPMNDEGRPSNDSSATGIQQNRILFAEKVNELMQSDSLDRRAALTEAAKRYPELAKAYRQTAAA